MALRFLGLPAFPGAGLVLADFRIGRCGLPAELPVLLRLPSSIHAGANSPAETARRICRMLSRPPSTSFPFAEGSVSASRVARPARRSLAFRPRMFSGPLNAVLCHRSASACAVASADRLGCSRPKRQWLGGSRSHWGNALSTAHRRIFFTQLEILHTIVVACFRRRTCLFLNPVRNGIPGMEVEGNGRQESWECPVHRFR